MKNAKFAWVWVKKPRESCKKEEKTSIGRDLQDCFQGCLAVFGLFVGQETGEMLGLCAQALKAEPYEVFGARLLFVSVSSFSLRE